MRLGSLNRSAKHRGITSEAVPCGAATPSHIRWYDSFRAMRRDVAQQLRFDNATDWAAAVGIPLLPLVYCAVVAIAGLEPGLRAAGDTSFSIAHASWFCFGNALWWLAFTLIAALSTQDHANGVLQRHSAQVKQMLQERSAPEAYQPLDAGHPRTTVRDTSGQETISAVQSIRNLSLRFGQWCRLLKEQAAEAAFQILKKIFRTLIVVAWILLPISITSVQTMLPAALLVVTVSGYMAFNIGYRIGVRWALQSNLELLGVAPPAK